MTVAAVGGFGGGGCGATITTGTPCAAAVGGGGGGSIGGSGGGGGTGGCYGHSSICGVTLSFYGTRPESFMSEHEHLRRVVTVLAQAGMEIRFSAPRSDPQNGTFFGVYARSFAAQSSDSLLGTCSRSQRTELEAIVAKHTPARAPKIEKSTAADLGWLSLVDIEINALQADWSLMTEDARKTKLAQIRDRLRLGGSR